MYKALRNRSCLLLRKYQEKDERSRKEAESQALCVMASGESMALQRMRVEVRERCEPDEGKRVGTLRPEAKNDPEKF